MDPQRPTRSTSGGSAAGPRATPASRRRVSRRTYLVRRVAAAGVAIALIAGVVTIASALFGTDDTRSSDPTLTVASSGAAEGTSDRSSVPESPSDPSVAVTSAELWPL